GLSGMFTEDLGDLDLGLQFSVLDTQFIHVDDAELDAGAQPVGAAEIDVDPPSRRDNVADLALNVLKTIAAEPAQFLTLALDHRLRLSQLSGELLFFIAGRFADRCELAIEFRQFIAGLLTDLLHLFTV